MSVASYGGPGRLRKLAHIAKSEQRGDWETPPELFHRLDDEFGPFTLDAAAEEFQYTAQHILTNGGKICVVQPEWEKRKGFRDPSNPNILYDAFEHPWYGRVWLNPP